MENEENKVEKLSIRQANGLVERIQPKWSTITNRFFLYCVASAVDKSKDEIKLLTINTFDLPDILGYEKGTNLQGKELETIFNELKENSSVSVKIQNGKHKRYEAIFLFDRFIFTENKIEILFSKSMDQQLLQLGENKTGFTDFKYAEVIDIQGSYSTRLIELLHQYKKIGKRVFEYQELRQLLCVPDDKYKDYSNFKKWILNHAEREINENKKSTIIVSYKGIRVGKSIGKIEFVIKPRKIITEKEDLAAKQIKLIEEEIAAEPINPDSIFAKIVKNMGVIKY